MASPNLLGVRTMSFVPYTLSPMCLCTLHYYYNVHIIDMQLKFLKFNIFPVHKFAYFQITNPQLDFGTQHSLDRLCVANFPFPHFLLKAMRGVVGRQPFRMSPNKGLQSQMEKNIHEVSQVRMWGNKNHVCFKCELVSNSTSLQLCKNTSLMLLGLPVSQKKSGI